PPQPIGHRRNPQRYTRIPHECEGEHEPDRLLGPTDRRQVERQNDGEPAIGKQAYHPGEQEQPPVRREGVEGMHFWQGKPHHHEAPRNVDNTRTRDKAVPTFLRTRTGAFGPTIDLVPLDIAEKGLDIAPRIRPIVHLSYRS